MIRWNNFCLTKKKAVWGAGVECEYEINYKRMGVSELIFYNNEIVCIYM